MVAGIFSRLSGMFTPHQHQELIKQIDQLESDRKVYDARIDKLARVTMDGEDKWFLDLIRNDPTCILKVIEECDKKNG